MARPHRPAALNDRRAATTRPDSSASPAERAAILSGTDSPELSDGGLDVQAAFSLARAWRAKGADAKKLLERAKADDLLQDAAAVALTWK